MHWKSLLLCLKQEWKENSSLSTGTFQMCSLWFCLPDWPWYSVIADAGLLFKANKRSRNNIPHVVACLVNKANKQQQTLHGDVNKIKVADSNLEKLGVFGRIILKRNWKCSVRLWTGFCYLRTLTSGGLLWTSW